MTGSSAGYLTRELLTQGRSTTFVRCIVVTADGLSKRDVFRLPDPFAVITVDAEQTHTTFVIQKTLNPYWNESFDMCVPDLNSAPSFYFIHQQCYP
jgi:C2 domain